MDIVATPSNSLSTYEGSSYEYLAKSIKPLLERLVKYGVSSGEHLHSQVPGLCSTGGIGFYLTAETVQNTLGRTKRKSRLAYEKNDLIYLPNGREHDGSLVPIQATLISSALQHHPFNNPGRFWEAIMSGDLRALRLAEENLDKVLRYTPHLSSGVTIILLDMFFTREHIMRINEGLGIV